MSTTMSSVFGVVSEMLPVFNTDLQGFIHSMRFELTFLAASALILWMIACTKQQNARRHNAKKKAASAATKWVGKPNAKQHCREDEMGSKTADTQPKVSDTSASRIWSSLSELSQADKASLADTAWALPKLRHASIGNTNASIAALRKALKAGLDLQSVPLAERDELLGNFLVYAIRNGFLDDAMQLSKELNDLGLKVAVGLCTSAVKICTSKQQFQEAIRLFDVMAGDTPVELFDRAVWSCLLYCCVEVGNYSVGRDFFERMQACGQLSQKDYWNMVRIYAAEGDWQGMLSLIKKMHKSGCPADNVIYNSALATCVSKGQIEVARSLLDEMYEIGGLVDIITYNTLLKGYANGGNMSACFELFSLMKERKVHLSQVTYGTLLDGCINAKNTDMATQVFEMMVEEKCPMNCVLYTTLIKGFARAGKADEAMRIYDQMLQSNVKPDLITFSLLLKVHCDKARLGKAFELLEAMIKSGLKPDEVIFNNLLMGCANESNPVVAKRIYADMIENGIKPSNATFSILLRVFSDRRDLDEAFDMLKVEPKKHNIEIEPRLFSQYIQLCLRCRRGRRAVEAYELFTEHHSPSRSAHASILSMCMKLNMCETACEIITAAADHRADIDLHDILMVRDVVASKGKPCLVEACDEAIRKLGFSEA